MSAWVRRMLAHPLADGRDIDDPGTTSLRRRIIEDKAFLRRVYHDWYRLLVGWLPDANGPVLELGAGAGFLKTVCAEAITSEVFLTPGIDGVMDAQRLPIRDGTLRAIVMVDVLHHVPSPELFFAEAVRCLRPGGRLLLIEPWVNAWSRLIYSRLHHEPLDLDGGWTIPAGGPLSGANIALPWIMLSRDRQRFDRSFPRLEIAEITPIMPAAYLLSGGVSMRSLLPGWAYGPVRGLEQWLPPLERATGMFAFIRIERKAD
jgi:SAM-dependent methyltransferase